jgi:hypothetical protein
MVVGPRHILLVLRFLGVDRRRCRYLVSGRRSLGPGALSEDRSHSAGYGSKQSDGQAHEYQDTAERAIF